MKKRIALLATLGVLALSAGLVQAATCSGDIALSGSVIYVNPSTGSDSNSGSQSNPYKTIQKAIDESDPGDTIALADGTYSDGITLNMGSSGPVSGTITISGSFTLNNGNRTVIKISDSGKAVFIGDASERVNCTCDNNNNGGNNSGDNSNCNCGCKNNNNGNHNGWYKNFQRSCPLSRANYFHYSFNY